MMNRQHTHSGGFTVVIIAALFVAMAVIAAAVVERNSTLQQITRRDATREQLRKLSNAIIEYSVFNRNGSAVNLYPCPADISAVPSAPAFGTATTNCYDITGDTATETAQDIPFLNTVTPATSPIVGMVPVLTLSSYGIGIGDAFDPWNSRILYVVNRQITLGNTAITWATAQSTNPTLQDPRTSAGATFAAPDFILISLGRDRVGATSRAGVAGTACNAGSNPRFENCDNDTTFMVAPTYVAANAKLDATYQNTHDSYFDDILVWYRQ